jgi:hypothetical protein
MSDSPNSQRTCPSCGAPLLRVRRHALGRLISLVRPVARYRCQRLDCEWRGNLANQNSSMLSVRGAPLRLAAQVARWAVVAILVAVSVWIIANSALGYTSRALPFGFGSPYASHFQIVTATTAMMLA